ncbi:MAG: nucleotidyltransferase family protein [Acidobacteria bacterium]|nr:nucleotidyltransferase family protein [Acidobacteriota bacterium]
MAETTAGECGKWVAAVLTHGWRPDSPPPSISSAALEEITPLLLKTGCGGLGWWRIRHSQLRTSAPALQLKHAYISNVLKAERQEGEIRKACSLLRSAGIEPLLGKGWAVARHYPDSGLRSSIDIDLSVHTHERSPAASILSDVIAEGCWLDLHTEFRPLDRPVEDLFLHSRLVPLGEMEIRVLGPEDQLRLLSLHMLYHGVYRPVWLSDLGLALESLPPDFDWDYFLSGKPRHSDWVLCALGLAHQLLGANLPDNPSLASRGGRLPSWLVPSVLDQWGRIEHYMYSLPVTTYIRHPLGLLQALRLRWPHPALATVRMGGPFNELPRLPFQAAECVRRTGNFLLKFPRFRQHRN